MKQGWEVKKLGELCTIQLGKTPHRKTERYWDKDKNSSNCWLSIADMVHGKELFDSKEYVSNLGAENINITPKGTLILSFKLTLGRVSFAGKDLFTNEAIASLINLSGDINKKYLFYYFTFFDWDKATDGDIKVKGKTLNKAKLKALSIIVPPLPEQQRIVKILDKAFVAIDKAKQNAEQNLRNAKEVFENYLDDVFENEDFEEIELGAIANFRNGMNYSKSSKGESIKIVGVRDFQNNYWVSFDRLEKVKIDNELREIDKLKKDDIITVRSNGNPELIGRTLLADNVSGNVSHSGFTIRIRTHSKNITPSYLCHYLKARKTRSKLTKSGKGINIKSLNQVALSKLSVKHPRLLIEQKHIVQKLSELSKKTKKLEALYQQKIAHTEELKKSILQKAFRGEL